MKKMLGLVLLGSCCTAIHAADTYTIDPNHTHATFAFNHFGLSTFDGKIPAQSGTIVLDRAQRSGSIEVVFNPKGIVTGVPKFDDHLRGEDFFEVDKHPAVTFKSTKVAFEGDTPATVTGNLTIKDITKPMTLKIVSFQCTTEHPRKKVPACGANATAKIKRSDFRMEYALPDVKDEIALEIEVEALKTDNPG